MLEVDMKTTIKTLYQKGYNKTQIGSVVVKHYCNTCG